MPWRIEPVGKKSVVEVSELVKVLGNRKRLYIQQEVGYRWGHAIVEENPTEAIANLKDGEPLNVSDLGIIDWSYTDGCWSDLIGVDELSQKQQALLEEAFWPEDAGWEYYDSTVYFHGELNVTEEE